MITSDYDLARSSSPYKIINAQYPYPNYGYDEYEFYNYQAGQLGVEYSCRDFFKLCESNTFAMKTFLHLLYVNPNRTERRAAEL